MYLWCAWYFPSCRLPGFVWTLQVLSLDVLHVSSIMFLYMTLWICCLTSDVILCFSVCLSPATYTGVKSTEELFDLLYLLYLMLQHLFVVKHWSVAFIGGQYLLDGSIHTCHYSFFMFSCCAPPLYKFNLSFALLQYRNTNRCICRGAGTAGTPGVYLYLLLV